MKRLLHCTPIRSGSVFGFKPYLYTFRLLYSITNLSKLKVIMPLKERTRTVRSFDYKKNIFCIEGLWENDHRDKKSVKAAMDFLSAIEGVKTIIRPCIGEEAVRELLRDSMQSRYARYSILYLAFHGEPRSIFVGKRNKKMSLSEIAIEIDGRANGKIIHFGCCSTLDVSAWELRKFLNDTNALTISGFRKEIDFVQSMAFEMLYLQTCQDHVDIMKIKSKMKEYYKKIGEKLGFEMKHL